MFVIVTHTLSLLDSSERKNENKKQHAPNGVEKL